MGSIFIDGWKDKSFYASWNAKQQFVINPTLVSAIYEDYTFIESDDERDGEHIVTKIVVNERLEIITFTKMQDIVDLMIEKNSLYILR